MKVCLVDDHEVVRSGLKSLIDQLPEAHCFWEFDNGEELCQLIDLNTIPDIIILDLSLPQKNGREIIEYLLNSNLTHRIIILSFHITEDDLQYFQDIGIKWILSKTESSQTIQNTIKKVIDDLKGINSESTKIPNITPRELQFLELICDESEFTYDQIAELMGVHIRTIDSFRKSLFQKLNIKSKTGLVLYWIKNKHLHQAK